MAPLASPSGRYGPPQARPVRDGTVPADSTHRPALDAAAAAGAGGDDSRGALYRAPRSASVGQLLSATTSCTATVVGSRTGNVAVTAAHCVYWPAAGPMAAELPGPPGWLPLGQLIPGRAGDTTPYGRWPVQRAWVDPRWTQTGDPTFDVAFLRLAPRDGRSVAAVAGSQTITFTRPTPGAPVTVLGYPAEAPFDGLSLRRCASSAVTINHDQWGALQMPCAMTPGASGGPWLTRFDPATGAGTVTAVTSYVDRTSGRLSGIPIGGFAAALYQAADQAGTR
ncbi:hypothetical protein Psed_6915 (plasmid) [Pseudonocardia dioxanivorans CB1190]|uniref:Peptidase S1 and S6 chymotrypsin/Hap n=1 Tax=Pseudonocardia dioxanivorans (strain ATCC 55486 / DSM 44775 / JCM 13855 / CB1190) TaxID=675635 RepID=F2L710_PSEUX|nr:trypsin-like peptidase domain-containing protein [Pseudonocardia dioxanivorans]AEA28983.1 hypothetical protein Psed_6915 [Pseudonocardia dioxanivorans CB1190]